MLPEDDASSDVAHVMVFVAAATIFCVAMMCMVCCVSPLPRAAAPAESPARQPRGDRRAPVAERQVPTDEEVYVVVDQPCDGEYAVGLLRPRVDKKMSATLQDAAKTWEEASLSSRPTALPTYT